MSTVVDPTEIARATDRLGRLVAGLDLGAALPATAAELVASASGSSASGTA